MCFVRVYRRKGGKRVDHLERKEGKSVCVSREAAGEKEHQAIITVSESRDREKKDSVCVCVTCRQSSIRYYFLFSHDSCLSKHHREKEEEVGTVNDVEEEEGRCKRKISEKEYKNVSLRH